MQNVVFKGTTYSNVPAINLPNSNGGTSKFVDVTDTTAVASDVASGKIFHLADGSTSTGTNSGGGGSSGTDTSDATLTSGDQMLDGVTAYSNGVKYTGTIESRSSSDLTASGATVTVPAGNYAEQATKSVASGSASTPATTITVTPSISVSSGGLITASVSDSESITPTVSAGYVSSGTAGTVTVSGSDTEQLTTLGATTYTPSTSDQTISSGTYLTGTQTISGDANLVAGNIKSGATIFGVTGSYTGGGSSIYVYQGVDEVASSSYVATDLSVKVTTAGTYKCSWMGVRNTTSGTSGSQLYVNGTAEGTAHTAFTRNYYQYCEETLALAANDTVTVYARSRNASYYLIVANLIVKPSS